MRNWLKRRATHIDPAPIHVDTPNRADVMPGYFGIDVYNAVCARDFEQRLNTDELYNWLAERTI